MNQRWRDRRDSYRPSNPINTLEYDVAEITSDNEPKAFIQQHHYSGSYPAARFRFGLYHHAALVGVAVFSHPSNDRVLTNVFGGAATDSVELGRFVLLDEVPGNGETWFLGRCFERLRALPLNGVLSFSDPLPRRGADGSTVFKGHVGTIYQAYNGAYLGRGTRRTLRMLPNGDVFSDRSIQKVRSGERGWRYAARLLEAHGADQCPEDDRTAWLGRWLPVLSHTVRHPGNHKYAWSLRKPRMINTLKYPKTVEAA